MFKGKQGSNERENSFGAYLRNILERSKNSFTVTAARVENKEELFIGAKEETRCFRT
jgi:hypothetical protein